MGQILQIGNARVDEASLKELCRRYGVRELSYFGSAARGQMRPDSDIDILSAAPMLRAFAGRNSSGVR